jgi:hypothetical protein
MRQDSKYLVLGMDRHYEMVERAADTLAEAKRIARSILRDPEYRGVVDYAKVLDSEGDCVFDLFAK